MAYSRPAIEVIQEFQEAAAALALPTLPACIVGPGFQIKDDVDAGIYSGSDLSVQSFSYDGLASGAIVDLTDTPDETAEANVHKGVGVTLQDAYLVKEPALPATSITTGKMLDTNLFQDPGSTSPFSGFDPTAGTFYLELLSGADAGDLNLRIRIVSVDDVDDGEDNQLTLGENWVTDTTVPVTGVEYRIIEFREEEIIPEASFTAKGIAKTATAVTINPGLTTVTDTVAMAVDEATVLLSWRALRPDVAGALNAFTTLDSLEAIFGVGSIVPANIGPYAVSIALQNTTTEVSFTGLGSDYYTNEEQSYQSALEYLETVDQYAISICTQNTAIHQTGKTHVEGMSASSVGKERVIFVNRALVTSEVLIPASGIGTVTAEGTGHGTSGTDNKTFKDPDNGAFITNSVNTGHTLEISSYTAVEGVDRAITPNEADFFLNVGGIIHMTNGAFTASDVGKYILARGATTAGNNVPYQILTQVVGSETIKVTTNPAPATSEAMPATAQTWVASTDGGITENVADNVTSDVWEFPAHTFTDGSYLAGGDIGKLVYISGTANGNDGLYTIESVVSDTTITFLEKGATDEVFGAITKDMYTPVRNVARDITHDAVDGPSRQWTFVNGAFTDDDVGRKLDITSAVNPINVANTGEHVIEAVLGSTQVRTDNTTTPVTEEFEGISTNIDSIDVVAVTPTTEQAAYITGTSHEIASVSSQSQLTLTSDPTAGFGGTLEDVVYRITKDLTLNEQATVIAGYSTSLGSRRVIHTWPDVVAVSLNAVATTVPGYFVGAALAAMSAGLPSQSGFTNLSLSGFVGRENSDDIFSDTQLDTIAGGGTLVLTQPVTGAALAVRHQLTTDVSTIYFQEYSVTKNVDLLSRFFRGLFSSYIGVYNITDTLLDMLKTRGEGGIEYLKSQRAPRVGAPLRSGQLSSIEESTTQPDSVTIDVSVNIPLPLNNITLTLLV